jgi:Flp pilus assembly protein TadG
MLSKKTERGQALILITFALIGLIALTGLTVDGGMAYSDRRSAQNAADSAAFAAALAYSRGQDF